MVILALLTVLLAATTAAAESLATFSWNGPVTSGMPYVFNNTFCLKGMLSVASECDDTNPCRKVTVTSNMEGGNGGNVLSVIGNGATVVLFSPTDKTVSISVEAGDDTAVNVEAVIDYGAATGCSDKAVIRAK